MPAGILVAAYRRIAFANRRIVRVECDPLAALKILQRDQTGIWQLVFPAITDADGDDVVALSHKAKRLFVTFREKVRNDKAHRRLAAHPMQGLQCQRDIGAATAWRCGEQLANDPQYPVLAALWPDESLDLVAEQD